MILQIVHLKKFSAKNKRYPDKRAFSWLIYEEVFVIMIEIQGENEKGLKVFINGIPDIKEISLEKLRNIIAVVEMEVANYFYQKEVERVSDRIK